MPQGMQSPAPRALPREQHELLQVVYSYFHTVGSWPDISRLQRELARSGSQLDVAATARQLPPDIGYADLGADTAVLTILGLRTIAPTAEELHDFVMAMSRCVALYFGEEEKPVLRSADLAAAGLDELRLKKLHWLLQREFYLTAGGIYGDGSWELHVRDTARHFKTADSIDAYLAIKARLDLEQRQAGMDPSMWQPISVPVPMGTAQTASAAAITGPEPLFVFVSHTHPHRSEATELATHLRSFGFSSFVAHDMIEPTADWQIEIEAALRRCDVLVAHITDDFHASSWTDQEVGWVLGRGRPIVAIQNPGVPYGFLARFQGLAASRSRNSYELALEVGRAILNATSASGDDKLVERLTEQVVTSFCESTSYETTRRLVALLRLTPGRYWSADRVERMRVAAQSNSQIAEAVDERVAVPALIETLIASKSLE